MSEINQKNLVDTLHEMLQKDEIINVRYKAAEALKEIQKKTSNSILKKRIEDILKKFDNNN